MNQIEGLKKFQQEKRVNTIERVKEAISTLKASNRSVNFKSVSKVSGITRKTLYKVDEIRTLIEELREESLSSTEVVLRKEIKELKKEIVVLQAQLSDYTKLKNSVSELKKFCVITQI